MARTPITWRNVGSSLDTDPLASFNRALNTFNESLGSTAQEFQGIADRQATERGRNLESLFRERITGLDALDANAGVLRDQNALRELAGGRVSGFNGNEFLNSIRSEIENPIMRNLDVLKAKALSANASDADIANYRNAVAGNSNLANIAEYTGFVESAENQLINRQNTETLRNFDPTQFKSVAEANAAGKALVDKMNVSTAEREAFLKGIPGGFNRQYQISDIAEKGLEDAVISTSALIDNEIQGYENDIAAVSSQMYLPQSVQIQSADGQTFSQTLLSEAESQDKLKDLIGSRDTRKGQNIRNMLGEYEKVLPTGRINQVIVGLLESGIVDDDWNGQAYEAAKKILDADVENNQKYMEMIDEYRGEIENLQGDKIRINSSKTAVRKNIAQKGFDFERTQKELMGYTGIGGREQKRQERADKALEEKIRLENKLQQAKLDREAAQAKAAEDEAAALRLQAEAEQARRDSLKPSSVEAKAVRARTERAIENLRKKLDEIGPNGTGRAFFERSLKTQLDKLAELDN